VAIPLSVELDFVATPGPPRRVPVGAERGLGAVVIGESARHSLDFLVREARLRGVLDVAFVR
jgi:hypothetical protein